MRWWTGILIGLAVGIVVVALWLVRPDFLDQVELKTLDARFRLRGVRAPGEQVLIVAADSRSIDQLGRWPWPRAVYADLISKIASGEPLAIGLDMVFSEPEREPLRDALAPLAAEKVPLPPALASRLDEPSGDEQLASAIRNAGNVILGYILIEKNEATGQQEGRANSPDNISGSAFPVVQIRSPDVDTLKGTDVETHIDLIAAGAASHGFFNIKPDGDGVVRSYSLAARLVRPGEDDQFYPSLALATLRVAAGGGLLRAETDETGRLSLSLGGAPLPVDETGRMFLNWYGPGLTFEHISAVDVLEGKVSPGRFRNRVVFFGATEIGIYDLRSTPFDPVFPGVEVHATVVENFLDAGVLHRSDSEGPVLLAGVVLLSIFCGYLVLRLRRAWLAAIAALLISGAVFAGVLAAFWFYALWVNLVYPLIAIASTYTAATLWQVIVVERRAREVRGVFQKYVSASVVEQLLKNPRAVRLGGEKREMTMLFSDIRGFTSLSEGLDPQELVAFLNQYFTPMTEIVFRHNGTLDKYMGDALMAFWGAPLPDAEHAKNACRAAIAMREKMEEIKATATIEAARKFAVGIGVNTGTVAVGNMGSERVYNYTVIGDPVNLASRLEGLNKNYATRILVSETVVHKVAGAYRFRELDRVRVKGKAEPVSIYELLDEVRDGAAPPSPEEAAFQDQFARALAAYFAARFDEAIPLFEECARLRPEDGPSRMYASRCQTFLKSPPPPGWDGVWVFQEK